MTPLLLASAVLGAWTGRCHVAPNEVFRLPDAFTDRITISVRDRLLLVGHEIGSDPQVPQAAADKVGELLLKFIQGPEDLSTVETTFRNFEYAAKPGDVPEGKWDGYTANKATIADPTRFTFSNMTVVGDAVVDFFTDGTVSLASDGTTLTYRAETVESQHETLRRSAIECRLQKAR